MRVRYLKADWKAYKTSAFGSVSCSEHIEIYRDNNKLILSMQYKSTVQNHLQMKPNFFWLSVGYTYNLLLTKQYYYYTNLYYKKQKENQLNLTCFTFASVWGSSVRRIVRSRLQMWSRPKNRSGIVRWNPQFTTIAQHQTIQNDKKKTILVFKWRNCM